MRPFRPDLRPSFLAELQACPCRLLLGFLDRRGFGGDLGWLRRLLLLDNFFLVGFDFFDLKRLEGVREAKRPPLCDEAIAIDHLVGSGQQETILMGSKQDGDEGSVR